MSASTFFFLTSARESERMVVLGGTMTNEERKAALLARWNAPGSKLAIRVLSEMDNVCAYYTVRQRPFVPVYPMAHLF